MGQRLPSRQRWHHDRCSPDRSYAGATDGGYHLRFYLPSAHRRYSHGIPDNEPAAAASHDGATRCLLAIECTRPDYLFNVQPRKPYRIRYLVAFRS